MILPGSYSNGFAPRDGRPLFPELWRSCVFAAAPCLGPTGLTLRDWSGYSQHGELFNSPTWGPVAGIQSISTNGSTSYCEVADSDLHDLRTRDITYSCWVRTTTTSVSQILTKRSTSAIGNAKFDGYSMAALSDGKVNVSFRHTASSDTDAVATSLSAVNDGRWHNIAGVIQRSGSISLYVDGVYQSAASVSYASGADINLTQPLSIGRRNPNGQAADLFFNGSVAVVRIYQSAQIANVVRLAARPGIAHELAPIRFAGETLAAYTRRLQAAQLVGGGLVG